MCAHKQLVAHALDLVLEVDGVPQDLDAPFPQPEPPISTRDVPFPKSEEYNRAVRHGYHTEHGLPEVLRPRCACPSMVEAAGPGLFDQMPARTVRVFLPEKTVERALVPTTTCGSCQDMVRYDGAEHALWLKSLTMVYSERLFWDYIDMADKWEITLSGYVDILAERYAAHGQVPLFVPSRSVFVLDCLCHTPPPFRE